MHSAKSRPFIRWNANLKSIKFITGGSDLFQLKEISLFQNTSQLVDFELVFGQNETISIEKLNMTFEALGGDSRFCHMKNLIELTLSKKIYDSPVEVMGDAFRGLSN
jgi:hypothetical protein